MRQKPEVGQVLFSLAIGNRRNRYTPDELIKVTVTRVARKYFYCTSSYCSTERKFRLDNWEGDYDGACNNSRLYVSRQEYEDEKEAKALFYTLRHTTFKTMNCTLSLDQLRRIKEICDEK